MVPWMLTHSLLREGPQQEHSHQFKGLQSGIQAKKRESAQKQAPVEAEPKTVEIGPTFDGPTPILWNTRETTQGIKMWDVQAVAQPCSQSFYGGYPRMRRMVCWTFPKNRTHRRNTHASILTVFSQFSSRANVHKRTELTVTMCIFYEWDSMIVYKKWEMTVNDLFIFWMWQRRVFRYQKTDSTHLYIIIINKQWSFYSYYSWTKECDHCPKKVIWRFPEMGVPLNHPYSMGNSMK